MTKKTMIAIGVFVLATFAAGGAWWFSHQAPKIGALCVKSGEVAIAHDGSLLGCQDGVRWKTVN